MRLMTGLRMLMILVVTGGLLAAAPAGAQVTGQPLILDGDTLEVGGQRFRLFGIDAPELDQVCQRAERAYPCGEVARAALWDLVAGLDVSCAPAGDATTADGAIVALCTAGGSSLNENMVYTGWALADPRAPARYETIQDGAREARRGLWSGAFDPPWAWRERRRQEDSGTPAR